MKNQNEERKSHVYNPTNDDFTVTYDLGKDKPTPFTVKAGDIAEFPEFIANHVKKHLTNHIYNIRGRKNNSEDDLKEIMEEISV